MEIRQEKSLSKISICTRSYRSYYPALHWHYNYEICQVVKNKMGFLVNGIYVEAKEGDIVAIRENVVHRFMPLEEEAQVRIMQFSLKVLMEAGIPIKRLKVHITTEEMNEISGLSQLIRTLFETIEREGCTLADVTNPFQQCMVCALYCLLVRHFAEEGIVDFTKEQKDFLDIMEYVKEHFEEDIDISILAERLCMYRGRLSTIFTKYAGMSPKEYIYSLRIKKANELMNQGSGVIEAALQSGFQSVRTFNHIYKKMTGITPKEYKKRSISVENNR